MAGKPGNINNPNGRPKGVPNKTTKEIKELFTKFVCDNYENVVNDFKELESEKRVKYYLEFAKYVLPTAKEIDITTDGDKINSISKEERDKMISEITSMLK